MDRKSLKQLSWNQCKDQIWMLFVISLIIAACSYAAGFILGLTVIGSAGIIFLTAPLSLSTSIIYLNLVNGKTPDFKDAFSGFYDYWRSVCLSFFQGLFIALWTMLFFVPGFIKVYSYAMAPFIMLENPGMKALDAITASRKMMDGHKWELFVLDLSFIGWALLTAVTFGIAGIWYTPYSLTARANFYKKLKGEI